MPNAEHFPRHIGKLALFLDFLHTRFENRNFGFPHLRVVRSPHRKTSRNPPFHFAICYRNILYNKETCNKRNQKFLKYENRTFNSVFYATHPKTPRADGGKSSTIGARRVRTMTGHSEIP
ncbi:hypothetical protein [Nitratidesulfovibrio sp.]|uniref:hypothetical protein n=1 Tax=Nitratidesulfovibrio sp. TaxID=2802297 RepID=UPI00333EEC70